MLDLAIVTATATSAEALADTTTLAKRADELGYRRFWVAEHHNMNAVASTSPAVLMAHLAGATKHISVGSGGVMLPNHAPLVIAEQFALLEALHPGRVDLGVGRAPGSDPQTAAALRRTANLDVDDFPRDLLDVMGLLGDIRTEHGLWERFAATPKASSSPNVILLGSSNYSAQLAGMLGLPFAFAHHFDMGGTMTAVDVYRNEFRPSPILDEPLLIVTASVVAADNTDHADYLANPSRLRKYGMRTGQRGPLVSPATALDDPNLAAARAMPSNSIIGTPAEVVAGLGHLAAATGANELMLYTSCYDVSDRITTLELVAEHWLATSPTMESQHS